MKNVTTVKKRWGRVAFGFFFSLLVALFGVVAISQPAYAVLYQTGDVFAGVGDGYIKHFDNSGNYIETLDTGFRGSETTGMAFDSSGNLFATAWTANRIVKFDNTGVLLGAFGGGYDLHPESIVIDAAGNIYVGQSDGSRDVLKFDAAGNLLDTYNVGTTSRGSDWIDLAADQHTLRYTSEGTTIKTFDLTTHTQLADFATGLHGPAFAHRILSDGGELVADSSDLHRLDASGNIVQTYDVPSELSFFFALNLDPDGTSFWTGGYSSGMVYQIDIATGNVLTSFDSGKLGISMAGLTVFGEITQGGGGGKVPEPSTLILLGSGLAGLGFRRLLKRSY